MRIVTDAYSINKSFYFRYCVLFNIKNQWYVTLLLVLLFGCGVYFKMRWMYILALVFECIYLMFWASMAYFFPNMPLGKKLFEKYSYIFSDQGLYIHIDATHFHLVHWGEFLKVIKQKKGLFFFVSRVQFFYIPKNILKSDIEYNILCVFLKNKGLIP